MSTTPPAEREYEFTLTLAGVPELTAELENGLFEAGCDDATLSFRSGVATLDFCRTAGSLKDAILSAVRDVRRAGIGADVARIDAGDHPELADEIAAAVA